MDPLTLLILTLTLYSAKACFSSQPAPTPTPPPPTSPSNGNTLSCLPGEKNCLHGGTCYVTMLGSTRVPHCQCPVGYTGDVCQSKTGPDNIPLTAGMVSYNAGAIAGIVIAIILAFFIIAAIFFLVVRKRRKNEKPKLDEPYTYSQADKPDASRARNDNFGVHTHMHSTGSSQPAHPVASIAPAQPYSGQRNRAFEPQSQSPNKPSIKRADNPDSSRVHSTLSNFSRPSSNNGSTFHHNSSLQSSASNCPVAHHESTV